MLLALRQAGLAGKARFVGFDASPSLVEALRKDEIGALRRDAGELEIGGRVYDPVSPLDGRQRGIAMIYQELSIAPHLSVMENILLGSEPCRGPFLLGYISIGDPTTAQGYELRVIAAVVIGGASLSGGEGSVRGTLIGALIMTVVDNCCTKLELANWVQEVVTGAIIVAAVGFDRLCQQRAERARSSRLDSSGEARA